MTPSGLRGRRLALDLSLALASSWTLGLSCTQNTALGGLELQITLKVHWEKQQLLST